MADKCNKCKHETKRGWEYPCNICIMCKDESPMFIPKKPTNADRIRSMTDEELYNLIEKVKMCGGLLRTEESSSECRGCKDGFCCNVLQWLKSDSEV